MASSGVRSGSKKKVQQSREPSPATGWLGSPFRQTILLGLLLAITGTIALYYRVAHHPFLDYDDNEYVTDNAHVKAGLSADTITWAFTTYDAANWHPLTWFSHGLDFQLFDLNPGGPHATNLVLHVVNVVLLFWVLWRATAYAGRSLMVAALFALHPINVESVAWIAERKNLLSMLFFLLALGAYRWYARQPGIVRYLVVALWFALGLMAKPQVITLPLVLLLWDYWPLERMAMRDTPASVPEMYPRKTFRWLVGEKVPLLALSAASAVITMRAQRLGGGINPDVALSSRLANAVVSYARYLGQAFWPTHLAIFYPLPKTSPAAVIVAGSALLLVVISALAIAARKHSYLLVGWLWFLGTMVPMIGLVQVGRQARADRYAYLPFIGLFLMLCWGAADWALTRKITVPRQVGVGTAVLLVLAAVTHRQISCWDNNVQLWTHTLQVTGDNYIAEDYLGKALEAEGRTREAMPHFVRATEIEPSFVFPYISVAIYEHQQGKFQQALESYQKVISLTQNDVLHFAEVRHRVFANMASAYVGLGDWPHAKDSLELAVSLNPDNAEEWTNLGILAERTGDVTRAIQAFSHAAEIQPTRRRYQLLARALEASGLHDQAQAAMQQAAAFPAD
ncbi:MAG: tetratricopeptide repeat protein [Acidobacteriota bacterium]|nr:tetratricopeptide repeat protein [Acidobacteriota bacterium]